MAASSSAGPSPPSLVRLLLSEAHSSPSAPAPLGADPLHEPGPSVSEACWIHQLLGELRHPLTRATLVYCDNIRGVCLSTNPVHHQRTKHVEIDLHFVWERVALGAMRVLHVPTSLQYADIFT